MLTNAFTDSHRECAKLLLQLQENFAVDAASAYTETLLSMLLLLPSSRHKLAYYSCLLLNLSKAFVEVPALLQRAGNELMAAMPKLDAELAVRVAQWLSLHVSHFGFSLSPFAETWKVLIAEDESEDLQRHGSLSRRAFVTLVLERMMRLSYHERITRELHESLVELMPPKPHGAPFWASHTDTDERKGFEEKSAALLMRLRNKPTNEELTGWLAETIDQSELVDLVMHSLLDAGQKSPSHLERLFVKFGWLLEHVAASDKSDGGGRASIAAATGSFFAKHTQLLWLSIEKLIKHRVIDPEAVVSWLCSPKGNQHLGVASTWEALVDIIEGVIIAQREASSALSREEERYRAATEELEEGDRNEAAEERLATRQAALEAIRREKKSLFANLYVGVAGALSERMRSNAAEGQPHVDEWWRATIGLASALGRRYYLELPLVSIEMVVDGSEDVDASVSRTLFGGLTELNAFA